LFVTQPQHLTKWQQGFLDRLATADSEIAATQQHVGQFMGMVREKTGEQLASWLATIMEAGVPPLQGFAQSLQEDQAAVQAGLTLKWSNGQTEGQIHRLKLLKRQAYGRARLPLLRQRVLQIGA
jgi:transposase